MDFVPFDATNAEVAERQVLRPGVPATMRPVLNSWLHKNMQYNNNGNVYVSKLREIENNLDVDFNINPEFDGIIGTSTVLKFLNVLGDRDLLRAVDYRLHIQGDYAPTVEKLKQILHEGRSKYEPVRRDKGYRLAARVPEGVQDAAEQLMNHVSTPGRLLKDAWGGVYDLVPSDSAAYSAAVKAVEAAALPVLGISKATATLSDAIRAIEKRDSTWRLPFLREHTEYPSREVLLGMLKSLYRGQRDRHGSAAYTEVTHQEAEAAVLLAVSLVGWFSGGLVQERNVEDFA